MCINCGCAGHYRLECEAPPRCPTTLAYLGYGTERGSFYFVDAEIEEDDGPARIEILCPAPAEIDGLSLVFYFGSKSRRLTFELESPAPVVQLDPAPSGPEPGDRGLDEEGGSSEEGSSSEGGDDMVGAPPEPSVIANPLRPVVRARRRLHGGYFGAGGGGRHGDHSPCLPYPGGRC
ncbi:hypothetical protein ZWY2020_048898 [Hordeum vulgare]|nr:hypothetical protein ZWY2020_048898 [Hordeum vulgare]